MSEKEIKKLQYHSHSWGRLSPALQIWIGVLCGWIALVMFWEKFRRYKRYSRCQCLTVVNIFVTNITNLTNLCKALALILTFQDARACKSMNHSKRVIKEEYSPQNIFLYFIFNNIYSGVPSSARLIWILSWALMKNKIWNKKHWRYP